MKKCCRGKQDRKNKKQQRHLPVPAAQDTAGKADALWLCRIESKRGVGVYRFSGTRSYSVVNAAMCPANAAGRGCVSR